MEQQLQIIRQRDELEAANIKIARQNKHITDGINYAKLIQSAMLSRKKELRNYIPESFIFYRPKDIVSGDFYWYSEIDNKILVAAVDCTGHGVPGAFMSMIGYNLLNSIVDSRRITEPEIILQEMHKGINVALNQQYTRNQDGMDMSICVIDTKTKTLSFSGAMNPLILIKKDKLHYIRGSKVAVGGMPLRAREMEKDFLRTYEKQVIKLNGSTSFYIFSDGFADQFGGEEDRKFMINNFRDMLQENHKKTMPEQKEILQQTFDNWKGDCTQIDDVLVIGCRINFA